MDKEISEEVARELACKRSRGEAKQMVLASRLLALNWVLVNRSGPFWGLFYDVSVTPP